MMRLKKKKRLEQQGEKKMEFFGLKHGQTNRLSSLRECLCKSGPVDFV